MSTTVSHEQAITKQNLISTLLKSPHGDLKQYLEIGKPAAAQDHEFFGHLMAWNHAHGQIRDARVALPVVHLSALDGVRAPARREFQDNALAHMATLDPRNLMRSIRFAQEQKVPGTRKSVRNMVRRYLHAREEKWGWWERTAVQHRAALTSLYSVFGVRPRKQLVRDILFDGRYPKNSVFQIIHDLPSMAPSEAAGYILERRIPFLVAAGVMGAKMKDAAVVLALIERMSATELVTNTKRLEKLGIKTDASLRAAFQNAMTKARGNEANVLKTTAAAEACDMDEGLAEKLRDLQERQIEGLKARGKGVDGNWLVLADCSASMEAAIGTARLVAGALTKLVTGTVNLVFFNTMPRWFDASGKTYDQICAETRQIIAQGGTSIGCGLLLARQRKFAIDGIVVVSDAQENSVPFFAQQYQGLENQPPVYLYRCEIGTKGWQDVDLANSMRQVGLDMHEFDLRSGAVDYYSVLQLAQTMRVDRYSLLDEVYASPLLTLDMVLGRELERVA